MTEAWAAILAAITAGTLALIGGYWGARRQATDNAHVEHRQWLRGHRQQAYLALLEGWDAEVQVLMAIQLRWDGEVLNWQQPGGTGVHPSMAALQDMQDAWGRLTRLTERVDLLGPRPAHEAVRELEDAFIGMRGQISGQGQDGRSEWVDQEAWDRALRNAATARTEFHVAAARVLRAAPKPEEENDLL